MLGKDHLVGHAVGIGNQVLNGRTGIHAHVVLCQVISGGLLDVGNFTAFNGLSIGSVKLEDLDLMDLIGSRIDVSTGIVLGAVSLFLAQRLTLTVLFPGDGLL